MRPRVWLSAGGGRRRPRQKPTLPRSLPRARSKYNVLDEELDMTMDQFTEKFGAQPSRESLTLLVGKADDPADRVLVYFPEGDIGVKECKPFMTLMVEQGCQRGILIVGGRFSNLAKTVRGAASSGAVAGSRARDDAGAAYRRAVARPTACPPPLPPPLTPFRPRATRRRCSPTFRRS